MALTTVSSLQRTFSGVYAAAFLAAVTLSFGGANAQSLSLGGVKGDVPIEVYAEDGIEWQQDGSIFVARGNARAVRGEVEVLSDELKAHYREGAGGQSEVWRLDALGNVRIISNSETAYGSRAIYNADKKVLVIDGEKPRLVSGKDTLSASQQLEYWELKSFAVARGDAVAVRDNKRVHADVLVAHLKPDAKGQTRVYRVDAYDKFALEQDVRRRPVIVVCIVSIAALPR